MRNPRKSHSTWFVPRSTNATKPCLVQLDKQEANAIKLPRLPSSAKRANNVFGASIDPAPGGSQNRDSTNSPTTDTQETNPRNIPNFNLFCLPEVTSGGDVCIRLLSSHDAIDSGERQSAAISEITA